VQGFLAEVDVNPVSARPAGDASTGLEGVVNAGIEARIKRDLQRMKEVLVRILYS